MKSKKLRTIAATLAAIMLVAACPVMGTSAAGKCPVEGQWVKYVETEQGTTWYMADGRVVVTDPAGNITSNTMSTTDPSAASPSVPVRLPEQKTMRDWAIEAGLTPGTWNHEYEQKVFDLVNAEREKLGIPKLVWDVNGTELAQTRAKELSIKYGHVRPDGSAVGTENIAPGNPTKRVIYNEATKTFYTSGYLDTPESVVNAWMNSEGHYHNMMDYSVDDAGNIIGATAMAVGCYVDEDGAIWWVQVFTGGKSVLENPVMRNPLLETEQIAAPLTAK